MRRPFRLTLVCHGRTTAGALSFPGNEMLAEGEPSRVRRLVAGLTRAERMVVSPGRAALQTAELISPVFDVDNEIRDLDYGRWAGRTFADIEQIDPDAISSWLTDPTSAPHGGESLTHVIERVSRWMQTRLADGGHWIAITHPSVVRAAVIVSLGAPAESYWHIDVQHLGVADIRSDGVRFALRSLGRLD